MRFTLLAALLGLGLSGSIQAATIVNGSFEMGSSGGQGLNLLAGNTSIIGWTVGDGGIDYLYGSYWVPSNGAWSLDLSGTAAGSISQTIATVIGQSYIVSFDMAGNPNAKYSNPLVSMAVSATGNSAANFSFDTTATDQGHMGWTLKTYTFTATSASTQLKFLSLTNTASGPALDNVRIADAPSVPEPAGWAMMVGGFGMVGSAMRRKRTRVFA